jgi:hypothetical protein
MVPSVLASEDKMNIVPSQARPSILLTVKLTSSPKRPLAEPLRTFPFCMMIVAGKRAEQDARQIRIRTRIV